MKKYINLSLSSLIIFCCTISCNKKVESKDLDNENLSEAALRPEYIKDDMINGYKYSLGYISDALDQNLTIEDAKRIFGDDPLVTEEGRSVKLTYAINSNKLYENGMRITTISLIFIEEKFNKASIGFTSYSD